MTTLPFPTDTLTVRDQIAIAAMSAMITKAPFAVGYGDESRPYYEMMATGAYWYADAMLVERKRGSDR